MFCSKFLRFVQNEWSPSASIEFCSQFFELVAAQFRDANGIDEVYNFAYDRGISEFVRIEKYNVDAQDSNDGSKEFIESVRALSVLQLQKS